MHHPTWRAGLVLAALSLQGAGALAALDFEQALELARRQAPALAAPQQALAGAQAARDGAAALPDPRLVAGVDNFAVSGPERFRPTREPMTMRRIGLMQEVPNRAKRAARSEGAEARVQRERAALAAAELGVRREAALAWLATHYAERRAALLAALAQENRLLQGTLAPRIAAGRAMPAEGAMARQEALLLADRADELQRDIAKARAALRRWVGARGDEPLQGEPPALALHSPAPEALRAQLHHHADLAPYDAMQAMARAEAAEARAEERGDWSWEVSYARRGAQYGDMVSFQLSFDLPWQKGQRQQPQIAARLAEAQRLGAEREEALRRHREELEADLAELAALDAQHERLQGAGLALVQERVALALAAYEGGRGDLAGVLAARREALEAQLRLIDLQARRAALRLRLNTLTAER